MLMNHCCKWTSLHLLALCLNAFAAPDTPDTGFAASAGQIYQPNDYGSAASIFVQPDGKILVGSNEMASTLPGGLKVPLLRFNPDGTVDNTFFADTDANGDGLGIVYLGSGWPEVMALGLQSNGKIIAGGVMTGMNDGTTNVVSRSLVRINPDGTPDNTFLTKGVSNWAFGNINYVEDLTVEPDDKILITGGFGGVVSTTNVITSRYGIARLNADGSLDTTFAVDPVQFGVPATAAFTRGIIYQAARDSAGRYYIAGEFSWDSGSVKVLGRLFPNGQRDTGFNPGDLPYALWNAVALTPDGRVMAIGQIDLQPSVMVALNPDGSPAPGFALAAGLGGFTARPLQIDDAGRMLIYGQNANWLKRLNADGSLDATFNASSEWNNPPTPSITTGYFNTHTLARNGRIYAGGGFDRVNSVDTVKIVAFEGNALADAFRFDLTQHAVIENAGTAYIAVTRQGSAAAAGSVAYATSNNTALAGTHYSATAGTLNWAAGEAGTKYIAVPILNTTTATGDLAFTVNLSSPTGGAISGSASLPVTILDDEGSPVIISQPQSIAVKQGFSATFRVAVSSALPPTFQWFKDGGLMPGKTSPTLSLTAVGLADAADYTVEVSVGGAPVPSDVATLTVIPPAAVPEPGFTLAGVATPGPFRLLGDGSMLVLDGSISAGYTLRKLDSSLTVDPTFTVTTTPESGYTAANAYPTPTPLPDGKILVSGFFSHVNSIARKRLARLNADGSVDESFVPFFNGSFTVNGFNASFNGLGDTIGIGANGAVHVLVRTSNQGNRLFRLLPDGSADPAFSTAFNYSTNAALTAFTGLSDGSILIGYTAGGFGGFERGIRRVLPNGSFDASFPRFDTSNSVTGILLLDSSRFAAIHGNLLTIHNLENGSLLATHTFTGTLTSIQSYRDRLLLTGPTAFGVTPLPRLALFSLDGTVDDNFPGGSGPNANVSQAGIDAQGRILVTGSFTSWNGIATPGVARLIVDRSEVGFAVVSAPVLENGGPFAVEIVRYGNTASPASVRVTTTAGTAASPADFAAIDQVVSWAAGDSAPKTVSLTPVDDAQIEGDESLAVQLSDAAGVSVFRASFAVTLRDDDSLPKITAQPGTVLAVNGQPASLSVTATSPTALSYQWFLGGELISAATAATYHIASASAANEGVYTVRITNAYGNVWSSPARLTIVPPPGAISSGFTPLAANIFNNNILALATAPDGGVYAGGAFTSIAGDLTRNRLAKIDANGSLDTGFAPPDISSGEVRAIAVQADGKVLVCGTFTTVGGVTRNRVIRLNSNGTLDTDFSTAIGNAANGNVNAVEIESNGNILLAGSITSWNSTSIGNRGIVRLSPSGIYLGTSNTTTTVEAQDLMRLPDGSVLMSYNTTSSSAVKVRRLFADLTDDTSFVYASGRTRVENMAMAADGDYLFAGNGGLHKASPNLTTVTEVSNSRSYDVHSQWNGKILQGRQSNISRYLPNGTTDPAFIVTTQPNGNVSRFAARGDGKVWVGGAFSTYNGTTVNKLFLMNADVIPIGITRQPAALTTADPGSDVTMTVEASGISAISYQWFRNGTPVDGAIGPSILLDNVTVANNGNYTCTVTNLQGSATSNIAQVIVLDAPVILSQTTGPIEILEGSGFTLSVSALGVPTLAYEWRRNNVPLANGPGISGADSATLSIANAPATLSGSFTVVVSNSIDSETSAPIAISVVENPAAMAPGFVPPSVDGLVRQVYPLPGGKVLIGGDFTSASDGSNTSGSSLAVVNADGSIHPVAGLSVSGSVYAIRDGGDGKILIAGNFQTVNDQTRYRVARLNADFSLDSGFDASNGFGPYGAPALDVAREASGSILVVGQFTNFNADPAADYAVRLTAAGAYDPSFVSGANSNVYRVMPQADGGAIFLGWFSSWSGSPSSAYVVRTDANGARNTTYSYSPTLSFPQDGLDLGGGAFIAAAGYSGIAEKYNPDGSKDTNFLNQGTSNVALTALGRDSEGRFLLGGNFTNIVGANRNRLVRILPNGTRDDNFAIGSGFNNIVEDLAIVADGSIWVGGGFTGYNGNPVQRLVRLKGTSGTNPPADPIGDYYIAAGIPEGLRGDVDDADADGVTNLIEYLYQTNPMASGSLAQWLADSGVTSGAGLGGGFDPAKSYRFIDVELPKDRRGLNIQVQTATDLLHFSSANATPHGVPVDNGTTEIQRYVLTPAASDAPALFWRVAVGR